jgi:hypothetical protein
MNCPVVRENVSDNIGLFTPILSDTERLPPLEIKEVEGNGYQGEPLGRGVFTKV